MNPVARRTRVVDNQPFGFNHFRVRLEWIWSGAFEPGQFFMLGELSPSAFILPRAFSVYRGGADFVDLVYKVVGRGSKHLATLRVNDNILAWGPLGCGFNNAAPPELLVAGGIGIAGLFARAEAIARAGRRAALLFGGRTHDDLVGRDDFEAIVSSASYFTEDGSFGRRGRVTDGLLESLRRGGFRSIAACGPAPMLDAVASIAREAGVAAQVSVEAPMACGLGACLGCTVAAGGRFQRACTEGPVFDAARFGEGPR